jgi:glycosyltransferase involved in cell wall biosynthesis
MTERSTDQLVSTDVTLVLHVIPTPRARGAQREARALADLLDAPGTRHHRVLTLFAGPPEVEVDASLDHPGGDSPAVGFDPRLAMRLRTALDRMDPDVVVAHGGEPLKYLVAAMIGRHRPMIYYAIGTYSGSDRPVQLYLWRRLLARADAIAAEGEEVRDECIGRLGVPPRRVIVVPNGRDPEVFHPPGGGPGSEPLRVGFVGALTEGKGPDRFIDVVAALRAQGARMTAVMIGDGPLRPELAGPAATAGVELLGPRGDIADQLRRTDVMVFPSRPAGEGMPGVLIEAGLSGVAVVATAVPGVASIVKNGETGFVVPVDDVTAMVGAAARLLDDPALRSSMGRAAREHCLDNFSIDTVGRQWMRILEPVLAGVDTAQMVR